MNQLGDLSAGAFVFHSDSATVGVQEERFDPPLGVVGANLEISQRASVSVLGVDLVLLEEISASEVTASRHWPDSSVPSPWSTAPSP